MTKLEERRALEAEATAAPWRKSEDEPSDVVIYTAEGHFVGNVGDDVGPPLPNGSVSVFESCPSDKRDEVNARLIVALRNDHAETLDLLEAVEEIVVNLDRPSEAGMLPEEMWDRLRTAFSRWDAKR